MQFSSSYIGPRSKGFFVTFDQYVNPLHPNISMHTNISMHILHTGLYIFP